MWNWLASSSVACVCILGKKMAPVIIIQDMKDFPENKMDRILYFIRYEVFSPINEASMLISFKLTVFPNPNPNPNSKRWYIFYLNFWCIFSFLFALSFIEMLFLCK